MVRFGMRRGWIFGLLLALAPATGSAQDGPGEPGKEHKRLDDLAGKWDVAVTYTIGPGMEHKGTTECEAAWILDGRFLRQEYKSRIQGRPFVVLQHLGFDRRKGKFVELKMDNMDTGVMHNEGDLSPDGKTLTCVGDRIDPADGKPRRLRTVYTFRDHDHFTIEWFTTDAAGKEAKAVELSHTRKTP